MRTSSASDAELIVSVCVITYNHEAFIRTALDSILQQHVNFAYEIVVGEDCSTDHTRAILLEYKEMHPDRIRLLLHDSRLGMMQNLLLTLDACRGKYIAMCEGDDYWLSPNKLQRQVDLLESHPEYTITTHNVLIKKESDNPSWYEWLGRNARVTSTLEDLLRDGSGGATCSIVFRKGVFGEFPEWYRTLPGGDWTLQILCASRGKMYYFPEPMGVYRQHDRGSTYAATLAAQSRGEDSIAVAARNSLRICDALDRHFAYRFSNVINRQRAYWRWLAAHEYYHAGMHNEARRYLCAALPHLVPTRPWLTLSQIRDAVVAMVFPQTLQRPYYSVAARVRRLKAIVT